MPELTQNERDAIQDAKNFLESYGFVVLREKSYRQAQERQRVAEELRRAAEEDAERARLWAQRDLCPEIRRLSERCTFLYGAARAAGCTTRQLRGTFGEVVDELDEIDAQDESEAARV